MREVLGDILRGDGMRGVKRYFLGDLRYCLVVRGESDV